MFEGATPEGVAPGTPAGSYPLSNFEPYNSFPASCGRARRSGRRPYLEFTRNVDGIEGAAHDAGCDVVVARSAFVQNLPELLGRFAGVSETGLRSAGAIFAERTRNGLSNRLSAD